MAEHVSLPVADCIKRTVSPDRTRTSFSRRELSGSVSLSRNRNFKKNVSLSRLICFTVALLVEWYANKNR